MISPQRISLDQAKAIASKSVRTTTGHTVEARTAERLVDREGRSVWRVFYVLHGPPGTVVDGHGFVLVDCETGSAREGFL